MISIPDLTEVRRHLHRHPELSGQEYETTAFLSGQLTAAGIPHRHGPGGVGLITEDQASSDVPIIALRADIDALPITEESEAPYRSTAPGVMHACGHDAHAAMVLGATLELHRAAALPVRWRTIFQSSEEAGQGALDMVTAGAVEGAQAILAFHVDPALPAGHVAIVPGPQTSCCQDFTIEVRGRGGHGARPHLTIDPIAIAAHLLTTIYQAIPRQTDQRRPAIVTVGQIVGGHCTNVIPDTAMLRGTIRTLDPAVSVETRERLIRICQGVALAFGGEIRPTFERQLNGVVNDPRLTAHCTAVAQKLLGPAHVVTEGLPSMGAEDFADYLTQVPGCMMRLGVKFPDKESTPLHTPTFDIDESALALGARLLFSVVSEWPRQLIPC